ncbi:hypothetical protein ES332_A11G200600v1 [Gossypium tomentosum]|uniref:Uncharacterized protein n=1 Tax=Gossypium tomentosum TaxID=34277 RepID=A0A5D2NE66_GOSTO|nr:hypothetical protein ES332_A11G200600v1 [Gossypium tomentosum]
MPTEVRSMVSRVRGCAGAWREEYEGARGCHTVLKAHGGWGLTTAQSGRSPRVSVRVLIFRACWAVNSWV